MKKILFVAGARPNFIKLSPVLDTVMNFDELHPIVVHTGQHYDSNMSDIFFHDLKIPQPDYHFTITSTTHGRQTAEILSSLEELMEEIKPDCVVVIGDVTSTLAGALAAAKLNIKTAHIEAGLRSFNNEMPEEINRKVADHISTMLFAPSKTAMNNLAGEGLASSSFFTGDVMFDAVLRNKEIASASDVLDRLKLIPNEYYLATLHRPYNVDNMSQLLEIISAFAMLDKPILFPVHPRTSRQLVKYSVNVSDNIFFSEPLGYLDFLHLQAYAKKIITDSGGIQKEAYFLKVPCITLRSETEWIETVESGANILVKDRIKDNIIKAVGAECSSEFSDNFFGNGDASKKIIEILIKNL